MSLIQVFIATYNRPSLVLNSIHSALNQDFDSFEVIVSDNSTNDETGILVSQINDKRLSYKRRKPSLPALDHLNAILQDVTLDYFIIFHDDDEMLPGMLKILHKTINSNTNYWAVGCNALKCVGKICTNTALTNLKKDQIFSNTNNFAKQYLDGNKVVPFPSYIYRSDVARLIQFDINEAGKYSDVTFLLKILKYGQIIFLKEPLMKYYFHIDQDSFTNDTSARNKLHSFIIKNTDFKKTDKLVVSSRLYSIYSDDVKLIASKNLNFAKLIKHFHLFIRNRKSSLSFKLLIRYIKIKQ